MDWPTKPRYSRAPCFFGAGRLGQWDENLNTFALFGIAQQDFPKNPILAEPCRDNHR